MASRPMWNASVPTSRAVRRYIRRAAVDPAEHQRLTPDLQLLQAVEAVADPDVPLGHGLEGAAPLAEGVLEHSGRGGAHGRQPLVREIHVGLLSREVRVGHTGNIHFAC